MYEIILENLFKIFFIIRESGLIGLVIFVYLFTVFLAVCGYGVASVILLGYILKERSIKYGFIAADNNRYFRKHMDISNNMLLFHVIFWTILAFGFMMNS